MKTSFQTGRSEYSEINVARKVEGAKAWKASGSSNKILEQGNVGN